MSECRITDADSRALPAAMHGRPQGHLGYDESDMPGATADMWDWWFGWHPPDPARYKLWHPDAHEFTCVAEDRNADPHLTDRARYINNVSFVDEYVGSKKLRLAIRFVEPRSLGFTNVPGTTRICARIGVTYLPVAAGSLVHQVRPTDHGSDMRSRFFVGPNEVLALPSDSVMACLITAQAK